MLDQKKIDAWYRNSFGLRAGYLPKDRNALDAWQNKLRQQVTNMRESEPFSPGVAALEKLIAQDGIIRMYVDQMIDEVPTKPKPVDDTQQLLQSLNKIVSIAPTYEADPNKRVFFPMSALLGYMMTTPAGLALFRNDAFNSALRRILKEWCAFLDSPASQYVLTTEENGWLSPSAYAYGKLDDFIIPDKSAPHWGFKSFNAYFHRQIKPEVRPVSHPDDPRVIVSANDGKVYKIARNVKRYDQFWIKGQPYSIANILEHDGQFVPRFVDGDVFQSFLSGADYHRWRAPIDGVVRVARVVEGLMFSNAESAGVDPTGTCSQAYQTAVNTRGIVIIESDVPSIGAVAVIPVGITEISSVTITVEPGRRVKKGDELGYFSYGGSSLALLFQPGAIDHFTVKAPPPDSNVDDGTPIQVNAQIAVAR